MAEYFTETMLVDLEISDKTSPGPLAQTILNAYNNNTIFTLELLGLNRKNGEETVWDIPNRTVVKEGNAYFIDLSDINTTPEGKPKSGIRMMEYEDSGTLVYGISIMGYFNEHYEETSENKEVKA